MAAASAAPAPDEPTQCRSYGNLSVGKNTSCSFAENVYNEWRFNGGGSRSFNVSSPVTNRDYWMTCVAGVPTICTGGNNAVVYIR